MPGKKYFIIILLLICIIMITNTSHAMTLKRGNRGQEVKDLQKWLADLGYDIKIDGIYGYQTVRNVKDFQYNNGLYVDGIAGKDTIKLIKERIKDIKYTVVKGDTLSDIALKFNSTIQAMKIRNKLKSNKIIIGQILFIPKTGIGGGREDKINANITHIVEAGEALSILSKKFGTDIETIKHANNLKNNKIYIGQELIIPHITNNSNYQFQLTSNSLIWPVLGRISSHYGYRTHPIRKVRDFHNGLDIAARIGTKIRAAASGTVVQSGWINGFGKTVVIKHGNKVKTLYAHNSQILVYVGQTVRVGDVIALAGSTGMSTGAHLHFGLLVNDKPQNPLNYLP